MGADAANDQHLDVVIDVGAVNEFCEAMPGGDRRRIEAIGAIQRDRRDLRAAILLIEHDLFRGGEGGHSRAP